MPGEEIPIEIAGNLRTDGWLPGTWVKYSSSAPSFSTGVIAAVERSDGTGTLAGFIITGPQHKQPVEELSDMWTTDTRQRAGGSTKADWTGIDAGNHMQFDESGLLQRMGSRVATMYVPPTGFFKFYVFETEDYALRHGGPGSLLTYGPGDPLYVSENGLLTSEQESGAHPWTGYVVARYDSDIEGTYIICAAAVM